MIWFGNQRLWVEASALPFPPVGAYLRGLFNPLSHSVVTHGMRMGWIPFKVVIGSKHMEVSGTHPEGSVNPGVFSPPLPCATHHSVHQTRWPSTQVALRLMTGPGRCSLLPKAQVPDAPQLQNRLQLRVSLCSGSLRSPSVKPLALPFFLLLLWDHTQ